MYYNAITVIVIVHNIMYSLSYNIIAKPVGVPLMCHSPRHLYTNTITR